MAQAESWDALLSRTHLFRKNGDKVVFLGRDQNKFIFHLIYNCNCRKILSEELSDNSKSIQLLEYQENAKEHGRKTDLRDGWGRETSSEVNILSEPRFYQLYRGQQTFWKGSDSE